MIYFFLPFSGLMQMVSLCAAIWVPPVNPQERMLPTAPVKYCEHPNGGLNEKDGRKNNTIRVRFLLDTSYSLTLLHSMRVTLTLHFLSTVARVPVAMVRVPAFPVAPVSKYTNWTDVMYVSDYCVSRYKSR